MGEMNQAHVAAIDCAKIHGGGFSRASIALLAAHCRLRSQVPHLPSGPTAKTGQTITPDDRGNDEDRFELVRRPGCAVRGANGFGAIQLSEPTGILVGFTPGVAPDLVARILAERFAEVWGSPFVVENVPGAGSNIATDHVVKANADGYTLLMGGNSALVINPSLYDTLPFDPIKDFAPISQIFIAANVLTVPPAVPVDSVAELVAFAKAQPGKLSYGHAGVGTSQHLAAELFKYRAHLDIAAVPYRGTTALLPDLLAHRISMSFANIVNVVPLAREGKLRALAITSLKRSALAPELPTMDESGYPGFEAVPWFGLLAPAGTPQDVVDKLYSETVKTLAMPEVRKRFDELGLEMVGNTPPEFAAIIRKEIPEWAKVIKDADIKLAN